jgi:hypothetical protein
MEGCARAAPPLSKFVVVGAWEYGFSWANLIFVGVALVGGRTGLHSPETILAISFANLGRSMRT